VGEKSAYQILSVKPSQNIDFLSVALKLILNQLHDTYHVAKGKEPILAQSPTPTGQEMRMGPKQMHINNAGFTYADVCEFSSIYMSL